MSTLDINEFAFDFRKELGQEFSRLEDDSGYQLKIESICSGSAELADAIRGANQLLKAQIEIALTNVLHNYHSQLQIQLKK